jgi:hypothetical protein
MEHNALVDLINKIKRSTMLGKCSHCTKEFRYNPANKTGKYWLEYRITPILVAGVGPF